MRTVIDVNAAAEDVTGFEAPLWDPLRLWPPVGVPDAVVDPLQPSPRYHLEQKGRMGLSRKGEKSATFIQCVRCQVSGARCQVPGPRSRVSSLRSQCEAFRFSVYNISHWDTGYYEVN